MTHGSSECYPKLWNFVRSQKPGWNILYASQLARVSYAWAARYCNWLESEGYIERQGKEGRRVLYGMTAKATRSPETPYPPRNPFEQERAAAIELVRLMRCQNPYHPNTARDIVAACKVILARFEKSSTQLENGGENK